MDTDALYEANRTLFKELLDTVEYAGMKFLDDSWLEKKYFKVCEVYRPQERQNWLYSIGRTRLPLSQRVTWTLTSHHTMRLAADVEPVGCSYKDIEAIANRHGIYRPVETLKKGDLRHFQFDRVSPKPPFIIVDPESKLRALDRGIARAENEEERQALIKHKARLSARVKKLFPPSL